MPRAGLRGRAGRAAPRPRSLSAANEVAVEAFLAGRIPWTEIAEIVEEVLSAGTGNADEVADVLDADRSRAGAGAVVAVDRRSAA